MTSGLLKNSNTNLLYALNNWKFLLLFHGSHHQILAYCLSSSFSSFKKWNGLFNFRFFAAVPVKLLANCPAIVLATVQWVFFRVGYCYYIGHSVIGRSNDMWVFFVLSTWQCHRFVVFPLYLRFIVYRSMCIPLKLLVFSFLLFLELCLWVMLRSCRCRIGRIHV